VTVFDSGVDGTSAFIVLELVAGPTLRQVLDQAGALPEGEAVRISAAVCEALQVAHAAGLVYRDIKPARPPHPPTPPHRRPSAPCPRPPRQPTRSSATCKPPSPTAR
jgi:serine/threonine protein kinase